jgi:hypothetical protein
MEEKDRPWLKPHVHTPAARDPEPGATRKRPLIYVYELPAFYNAVMLQVGLQLCAGSAIGNRQRTVCSEGHIAKTGPDPPSSAAVPCPKIGLCASLVR